MIIDEYNVISIDIPRTGSTSRALLFADIDYGTQRPVPEHVMQKVEEMRIRFWSSIDKHASALDYQSYAPDIFNN